MSSFQLGALKGTWEINGQAALNFKHQQALYLPRMFWSRSSSNQKRNANMQLWARCMTRTFSGVKRTITPAHTWWICAGSAYIPLSSKSLATWEVFEFMLLTPLLCTETPFCRWEIWVQQVHSLVFRVSGRVRPDLERIRPMNIQELCKRRAWEWGAILTGWPGNGMSLW